MKKLYFSFVILMLSLTGCTSNDGYIGSLFGLWAIDEVTSDGEPVLLYYQYTMRFQSDVVQITQQREYYQFSVFTGTWTESGDRLRLNFTHDPGGNLPTELGMKPFAVTDTKILAKTSKKLVLQSEESAAKVVYYLTKIN